MRDRETGVELIGTRDIRPIKVRVIQQAGEVVVIDSVTERPIPGVVEIQYRANGRGSQLCIVFSPDAYELILADVDARVLNEADLKKAKPNEIEV